MKESQNQLKAKTLILTHGDSDGICSGAIAKTAYPDAYVYFTSPVNLLDKLSLIEDVETLIICDIALDERHCSRLYPLLNEFAEKCNLYYIDHHPLPNNYGKEDWFYHDIEACSTPFQRISSLQISLTFLSLPEKLQLTKKKFGSLLKKTYGS